MTHLSRSTEIAAGVLALVLAASAISALAGPAPHPADASGDTASPLPPPGPAVARGTPPQAPVLTLEGAVREAQAINPQVAAARQAVIAAQQSILAARAGLAPTISANSTGSYGTTPASVVPSGVPSAPLPSATATGSLSLTATLPIYDSGSTRVAIEQAEASLAAAQAALRQTQQDIALQAATAFFNVLKAERLADVRQAQLARAQAQLAQAQAQFRAGVAALADVIQAQAQVAQAQVDLLTADSQIATAKAGLQGALGAEVAAPVEVQEPPAPPAAVGVTAEAAMSRAEANRPEIAKATAAIQSGQAALDQAYVSAGPQVSVAAGTSYTPLTTSPILNNSVSYGLTATLTLPLYDAGKGQAGISAAQANLRSAQAQFATTRVSIRQDAYQAYLNAVQGVAKVTATQAAQVAAEEALRVAEGRYRAGVGTILEVITARAQAAQAEVNAVNARYDYQAALATLQHAEGVAVVARVQGGNQ